MKKYTVLISSLCLTLMVLPLSCSLGGNQGGPDDCRTVYPVVLVHGFGFRDKVGLVGYWGEIPDRLRKRGATVFWGGQYAFASIERNAEALKKKIIGVLAETGKARVNIIAHSKGGIEARYMIAKLDMAHRVASLTTLATPHRGSAMADGILKKLKSDSMTVRMLNLYGMLIGDSRPDSFTAGSMLTRSFMRAFNEQTPDSPLVYYQSYACGIDAAFPNPVWKAMFRLMQKAEGPNDGLVSVESARWGNFRGVLDCQGKALVSHADIIGMHAVTGAYEFDAPAFFISLVADLKARGY